MRWRHQVPLPLPPEPDCDQVAAVLQAYLDGELGPEDAEAVANHLPFCDRCGIEAATVRQTVQMIRRQRPDLDDGSFDRLTGFVDDLVRDGAPPQ